MSRQQANLLCILTALIWGGGFVATDLALQTFTPAALLSLRFGASALLGWAAVFLSKEPVKKRELKTGILSGTFLYAAFALQTLGMKLTEPGMNAFLTSVNVVIVPYLSWMVQRKPPEKIVIAASFLCLIGLGCLSLSSGTFSLRPGDLLSLGCAFFFAAQIVSLAGIEDAGLMGLNAVQLSTAAFWSLPFGLTTSWPDRIPFQTAAALAYSVFLATFLCYLMQTAAQQHTSAAAASVLLATESLWANLFSFLFLHEPQTPVMLLGGLLIFLSVLLVEGSGWLESLFRGKKA